MLLRMVDYLKFRGITAVFTHLAHDQVGTVATDAGLSSLMDAWILLLNREANGEFNRELYLLKARGTSHSNQVREFSLSAEGIKLLPPYLGATGALTGSARKFEEARDRRAEVERSASVAKARAQIEQRRRRAKAQIEAIQAELDADSLELRTIVEGEDAFLKQADADLADMNRSRKSG